MGDFGCLIPAMPVTHDAPPLADINNTLTRQDSGNDTHKALRTYATPVATLRRRQVLRDTVLQNTVPGQSSAAASQPHRPTDTWPAIE